MVVDDYFGKKVTDAYRWLEDDMSAETAEWVAAQNKTTHDYLAQIPYRDKIKSDRRQKISKFHFQVHIVSYRCGLPATTTALL